MTNRQILSHAILVLPNRAVEGSLIIEDSRIAEVAPGRHYTDGMDLAGQYLIPGVIDIHTDYLEKELNPRPSASFPLAMAFHMMDVRAIMCGLTTVLGAARISGDAMSRVTGLKNNGIQLAKAYQELRQTSLARHLIHIRWNPNFEPVEEVLAQVRALDSIGNLVFNDSAPGERQFRDIEDQIQKWARNQNIPIEEARAHYDARLESSRSINNRQQVKAALAGKIPLGSHDDTSVEHVVEAFEAGATMAEMPCSMEAARMAKELGMVVCMGAPNYFRGGSHCGNLSCPEAMTEDLVDILCSDFHFPALLGSVVKMIHSGVDPSSAIRMVSLHPAQYLGMDNEIGSIEAGKKADLVAFAARADHAVVSNVWVDGIARIRTGSVVERTPDAAFA